MSSLNESLEAELDRWRADGLYRRLRVIASGQGARLEIAGRQFLNFSSNDYLGLAGDPALKQAARDAIAQYGVGAGASRLVCGNLAPYDQLERQLAAFNNKEAALVFGSGYAANVGVITALAGPGDVVILDKLDHASIIDGARQSGATIRVYPHRDMRKLESLLRWAAAAGQTAQRSRPGRVLIITETVFSMDGDLAPLAEIVALKEKYGAWLMADEAHAVGLYGRHRRGLAEPLGLEDRIDIRIGTLSKALGCYGGFVAGSQTLIDYLRNRARSLIYSTALPPAVCAAGIAAVQFVMSQAGHQRRERLWRNVSKLKHGLSALGIPQPSRSPIIPIIVGDEQRAVELSEALCARGMFVPAIRYPTVPRARARLRVTVSAAHTAQDIGQFLAIIGPMCGRARRDTSLETPTTTSPTTVSHDEPC
jgi:8-amino-7-oxononanoate synthase